MEYLMTYGWAILIIAVVLAALFSLGVFTNPGLGTSCIAAPGYTCTGLSLAKTGTSNVSLSLTFGQSTGQSIYNVGMACSATASSGGLPDPASNTAVATGDTPALTQNTIVYLSSTGAATSNGLAGGPATVVGPLTLINGATITVSKLLCYNSAADATGNVGLALTPTTAPIGSSFAGGIYMNYTLSASAPTAAGGTNPLYTVRVATFTAKVV